MRRQDLNRILGTMSLGIQTSEFSSTTLWLLFGWVFFLGRGGGKEQRVGCLVLLGFYLVAVLKQCFSF